MLDIWPKGRLVELSSEDCWGALRARSVGRFVWCRDGRPHVVPVNFAVDEDALWVRTAPYTQLAREAPGSSVAFEIDDIDEYTHSGLSVVVEGRCETADGSGPSTAPESWVDGTRSMVLRIETTQVSGRRLMPS